MEDDQSNTDTHSNTDTNRPVSPENQLSARFVISMCQDVLATTFRTLYQLHALNPDERLRRNKQAEKVIATWGTCEQWLQLSPFGNFQYEAPNLENMCEATTTLPTKLRTCVETIQQLKDMETYNLGPGPLRCFPDTLTPLPPPFQEVPSNLQSLPTPLPDLVIDNIMGFLRLEWNQRDLRNASLVCRAWNGAVRRNFSFVTFKNSLGSLWRKYLYEAHFQTVLKSKCIHRGLGVAWLYPTGVGAVQFSAILNGLCAVSRLRVINLTKVRIDAMTVVKMIARSPDLMQLSIWHCEISGLVQEYPSDDAWIARQHLKGCNSVHMVNHWMDYPDDFAVPTDLQLFVLTSIGPALHTLELGAWFPAAAGLDFPVLERLEYCYEQNGGPLPPLPPLKHLRVHSAKGLHDLIPSIGHLHVLDGNIEIDSLYPNPEAEVEDFFAALSLLRSPDILNVKVASSEHMVTNSPAIYEYLCGKGSLLKGLRLDGDVVSASIFAAASLRCRHLTHLVVNVGVAPTVQQLESLGIALFGLRCRNLRKIGFAGCWNRADEDVGEWIRRLKDDLSGLGSIDVELFSHSSFDHVCKEIEDGYSAWWDS